MKSRIKINNLYRIMIIISVIFLTAGCSNNENTDSETEMISNPDVAMPTDSGYVPDREGKEIVDGYWRCVRGDENNTYVTYVPIYEKKIRGIRDFEDLYAVFFTEGGSWNIYETINEINRPQGTAAAQSNSFRAFFNTANREFIIKDNVEVKAESSREMQNDSMGSYFETVMPIWNTTRGAAAKGQPEENKIARADIGCFTFALYEHLSRVPDIKLSFYGVTQESFEKYVTSQMPNSMLFFDEKGIYKDYKNGVDCLTFLTSCPVTETGIKYVDYRDITDGIEYYDIIGVLEIDEYIDEFSYYIDGESTYNIVDQEQYQKWKSEHKDSMIQ